MHDQMFMPPMPADSGRLLIQRVWEVRGNASYQCRWPEGYPHSGLVLVRTLAGRGQLHIHGGRTLDCPAGTVACLHPASIRGYGCREPLWSFWWLECGGDEPCRLARDTVTPVPPLPGEVNVLMEHVRLLDEGGAAATVAAAAIALLVRKWERLADSEAMPPGGARTGVIIDILTLMRQSLHHPVQVAELARRARLSEGRFRQLFTQATGMAPKAYYEHIRLAKAAEWLRETDMKLDDIAGRLGYSSPFHLSRAFKRRHGVPPSAFRPGRSHAVTRG